jgi:hypothetical protein
MGKSLGLRVQDVLDELTGKRHENYTEPMGIMQACYQEQTSLLKTPRYFSQLLVRRRPCKYERHGSPQLATDV